MIIKAGTYRFNDTLSFSSQFEISIPFTAEVTFEEEGVSHTVWYSCDAFGAGLVQIDNYALIYNCIDSNMDEFSGETTTYPAPFYAYLNGSFLNSEIQTITVTADTEVDDDSGAWFTSNTTMLIEAGTYRWSDELSNPDFLSDSLETYSIPFTLTSNFGIDNENDTLFEGSQTVSVTSLRIGLIDEIFCVGYSEDNSNYVYLYQQNDYRWNVYSETFKVLGYSNYELANGFGQIITITEDTYVPTTFGLWSNENWKKQGEEEETYTIGAGIYKFKSTLTRPPTDFSQEMSFAVVGSEQINETARYGAMETGRDMYLDFINVDSDAGIAFYAFEETSQGNIGFLWDTQTIQVLEPISASAVFNNWFTANTEQVTEETPTLPAVEITYKDKVITLNAGQTARLHNADGSTFGFTEDLVIKANAGGGIADNVLAFMKSQRTRVFLDDALQTVGVYMTITDDSQYVGAYEKIIIPECVTVIDEGALCEWTHPDGVPILSLPTVPPTMGVQPYWGDQTSPPTAIYVPDESVEAYKTATNWAQFADLIMPISSIEEVTV